MPTENKQNPAASKANSWSSLYRLQLMQLALFLGLPLFVLLTSKRLGPHALIPTLLVFGALWLRVSYLSSNWRCPGCGSRFLLNERNGIRFPFRWTCANCRIPRGSVV